MPCIRFSCFFALATLFVITTPTPAQTPCNRPGGADVMVGELPGVSNYGSVGGISAFSVGTTSCNVGDTNLLWIANTNEHPVIAQNMYRLKDNRFEQIGLGWVKHGFLALTNNACGCGCNGMGGAVLGVGCSDPYGSSLNGQQGSNGTGGLGPRYQIDAFAGKFAFPYDSQGLTGNAIFKRIQVRDTDLDPALNDGALYFMEGHYVTADDANAGNQNNNASHRQVLVARAGNRWQADPIGDTQREQPAIHAWKNLDPTVRQTNVQVSGEGLFILSAQAWLVPTGQFHYEYALANLNSDRSAGSFAVPIDPTATVTNIGFHDVDYHSGDGIAGQTTDGTDWSPILALGILTWSTETFAANANANALRWGTTYNFRFDADLIPAIPPGNVTIGMFKPGSPAQVNAQTLLPSNQRIPLSVWLPNGPPDSLTPGLSTEFDVRVIDGAQTVVPATATLHYRFDGGTFLTATLTATGGEFFRATLPPTTCSATPEFFVSVQGDAGATATTPPDAPITLHTAPIGTTLTALADDFEANQGWTVLDEGVTAGSWERGTPIGGSSFAPSVDFDGSGQCFQTGNAAPDDDLDGGPTRLLSPRLNLCRAADPQLSYARWFDGTAFGSDNLTVEISNDDGDTWTTIETVTATQEWEPVTFAVRDFITPTGKVRVRFSADDRFGDSVVEAAIDAFTLTDFTCDQGLTLDDFRELAACLQGPTGPSDLGCECYDADNSTHIDLKDYANFQINLPQ